MDNGSAMDFCDSENLIYQAKDEGEEDFEVPGELSRLLLQEERTIKSHEEPVDTITWVPKKIKETSRWVPI